MHLQKYLLILIGVLAFLAFTLSLRLYSLNLFFPSDLRHANTDNVASTRVSKNADQDCIPTFTDGGGPYYRPDSPIRNKIVPEGAVGDKLVVTGQILLSDCKTSVGNASLDLWQADAEGYYQDEWYRGRVNADEDGRYQFETIIPQGYGEGTGYRPPHIHFKVFIGEMEIITSQMFFPEARGRPGFNDAYIMELIDFQDNGTTIYYGYHDIILP